MLSHGLKYNFLRLIADMLPEEFPPRNENPLPAENDALKKQIEMLNHEIEIWKKLMGLKKAE